MKNALDGKRVAELRRNMGLEQQDLAEIAGVTPSVISRLERDVQADFKLSVILGVAKALDVTIDSLLKQEVQTKRAVLSPALARVIEQLGNYPHVFQDQAAGVLQGYLGTLKDNAP